MNNERVKNLKERVAIPEQKTPEAYAYNAAISLAKAGSALLMGNLDNASVHLLRLYYYTYHLLRYCAVSIKEIDNFMQHPDLED